MSLRNVVQMSAEERDARRELDEAAFRSVEAYCADGLVRGDALTKAAASLAVPRSEVVCGYWRHFRRMRTEAPPRRRRRTS